MSDRAIRYAFRVYKSVLSPVLHAISPSRCLYLPTCSEYAYTAVSRFGWCADRGWRCAGWRAAIHGAKAASTRYPSATRPHPDAIEFLWLQTKRTQTIYHREQAGSPTAATSSRRHR